ncbi:MAG: hypothetical protein HDR80_05700 [Bacteroides sp.]|nr:hypothetical protein [Bacteroides sp.]
MKVLRLLPLMIAGVLCTGVPLTASAEEHGAPHESIREGRPVADNILFIGDSMTGWLSEALNAYGVSNGFTVETVIWDGSTIKEWGEAAPRLTELIRQYSPEAIFVSLGLNNMAERNPEHQLGASLNAIMEAAGDTPVIWVGPPSWPGKDYGEPYNSWMASKLGASHYKNNMDLTLPRQSSTNPHPTKEGCVKMVDSLVEWLQSDGAVALPGYTKPATKSVRPKVWVYKKMREQL